MKLFYFVFMPGLVVFNGAANRFTSMLGVPPASETEETLSEEEIRMVLSRAGEKGHVEPEEVEMIERVFDLDDITARSVMVPRPDVVTVPADAPLSAVRALVVEHGHTRYPVVDAEDGERTVGYVDVKDVLRARESGTTETVTVGDVAREMPMVPETMRVDELLGEFQSQQRQMAAVVDEYGGLAGIATVEDAVETVVGEIRDDFDDVTREAAISRREDGDFVSDGAVPISAVNDAIGSAFEVGAYGTVGGLVLDRLGRPPEVGDQVAVDGFDIAVEAVDGARVETVAITAADADAGEDADEESTE
jgi:CBS domain containing-hemolysin-like protein